MSVFERAGEKGEMSLGLGKELFPQPLVTAEDWSPGSCAVSVPLTGVWGMAVAAMRGVTSLRKEQRAPGSPWL